MSQIFSPPWWAKNPHIQTILPVLTKVDRPQLRRERLELSDGDFIDLDWQGSPRDEQPILVIIHGLEGSAQSHYARRMLAASKALNLCTVVHHHRSCSGELNRLPRGYHSGDTQDLQTSLSHLKTLHPNCRLLAVGYSLGGNVLVKYQGEQQDNSLIDRGVAVSAPLQLGSCANRLEKGFSKLYQSYLIKQLQQKMRGKVARPELAPLMPISQSEINRLTTFYAFDDKITAPLHGFADVHDYYTRASGLPYLSQITNPTLVMHAKDDPFMTHAVIPSQSQLSEQVQYELHENGGHVGFIDGGSPWRPQYYLEKRVLNFLTSLEISLC
ncbi:alpha/beta hydrolase fold [Shewanella halifaxensis HAW-EB4]|uniref:Alpha/beta hydrolase fold n=1 Tax=Shewanella halifaxensis (strain HAW-EB4) TaxID=458817 RepID=B0TU29_SHEHH|nr:hydrolase [Shewanella halifaxensis]ABZ78140.1 alpha/beta hydrolase fold [Shewanella halifaxensis HAW-EB4]